MIAVLPVLLCQPVHAENWVAITSAQDGGVRQSVDIDSLQRHLEFAELWRVLDYDPGKARKVNGKPYRSQRIHTEFECSARAMRQRYVAWYSEPQGKGELLSEEQQDYWEIDRFDEHTGPLWNLACGQ